MYKKSGLFSLIKQTLDDTETDYKEKNYEIYHSNIFKALAVTMFLSFFFIAVFCNIACGFIGSVIGLYAISLLILLIAIHACNYKVICYKECFKVRQFFIYRSYDYKDTTLKEGRIYTEYIARKNGSQNSILVLWKTLSAWTKCCKLIIKSRLKCKKYHSPRKIGRIETWLKAYS